MKANGLPKGIRLDHGYVQIRISHGGIYYHKNFGPDSPLARELAFIHLAEKRKEILQNKFGIETELPSRKFAEVVPVYMKMWSEQKDGDGRPKHSPEAIYERQRVFDTSLIPHFGKMDYDKVRTIDVEKWREKRLADGVQGTSVNREMVPLSDMFSEISTAIAVERIKAFKQPSENPCKHATKAKTRKRERIASEYELKKLKLACQTMSDMDAWEIIKLFLKSVLSEKDLRKLEIGSTIDIERSKTGVPIHIPITILQTLNWKNWRKRWKAIREEAGCSDLQARDLRKTGGNYLVGKFDTKIRSQYMGHSSIKTTEKSYDIAQAEKMRPLAECLTNWTEGI